VFPPTNATHTGATEHSIPSFQPPTKPKPASSAQNAEGAKYATESISFRGANSARLNGYDDAIMNQLQHGQAKPLGRGDPPPPPKEKPPMGTTKALLVVGGISTAVVLAYIAASVFFDLAIPGSSTQHSK